MEKLFRPVAEFRSADEMIIEGKAISFDDKTVIYRDEDGTEYYEVVSSKALQNCDMSDVVLKYGHDSEKNLILARTRGGSLQLEVKPDGLYFRANLFDTQFSQDCYELVRQGALQCSFAFTVAAGGDRYDNVTRTRTINFIEKLWDVSIVDVPAYQNTYVSVRAYFEPKSAERRNELASSEIRSLCNGLEAAPPDPETRRALADLKQGHDYFGQIRTVNTRLSEILSELSSGSDPAVLLSEARELVSLRANAKNKRDEILGKIANGTAGEVIARSPDSVKKEVNMTDNKIEIRSFKKYLETGLNQMNTEERSGLVTSGAGAVIPTEIFDHIISDEKFSDLLHRATVVTSPNAGNMKIPVAAATAAAWHTETDPITPAAPVLTSIDLGGYELVRIVEYSAAVAAMSDDRFQDWISRLLASEMNEALEKSFIDGTGSGQPTGIESTTGIETVKGAVDAENLAAAIAKLPQKYARNAVIVANASTCYKIGLLTATNDSVINAGVQTFLGKEIVCSEHVADDVAYVVDPAQLYVRFSMEPTIEIDRSSGFTNAVNRMRVLAVVDAKWNPEGVCKISAA